MGQCTSRNPGVVQLGLTLRIAAISNMKDSGPLPGSHDSCPLVGYGICAVNQARLIQNFLDSLGVLRFSVILRKPL